MATGDKLEHFLQFDILNSNGQISSLDTLLFSKIVIYDIVWLIWAYFIASQS